MITLDELQELAESTNYRPLEDLYYGRDFTLESIKGAKAETMSFIRNHPGLTKCVNMADLGASFDVYEDVLRVFEDGDYLGALDIFRNYLVPNLETFSLVLDKDVYAIEGYRIRKSKKRLSSISDMHFPPVSAVGLVKSGRFSVPGIPAIYLGSSPEICLHELRARVTSFHNRDKYLCKYRIDTTGVRGFGLTVTIQDAVLLALQNSHKVPPSDYLNAYFSFAVPLILYTKSLVTRDLYFKKEHLIPQFLMIILKNQGYSYFKFRSSVSHKLRCHGAVRHFLDKNYAIFDRSLDFATSKVYRIDRVIPELRGADIQPKNAIMEMYAGHFSIYHKSSWIGKIYESLDTKMVPMTKISPS